MSFIYFKFNIEHDEIPKLVKIGGTKDYRARSGQHLTSGSCYIIVYSTQSGDTFHDVEGSIKKSHFLQRHYNEEYYYTKGMIRTIAKSHNLKLVCLCIPPKLHHGFSFIYKHVSSIIGKNYSTYEIGRPKSDTSVIEDQMSVLALSVEPIVYKYDELFVNHIRSQVGLPPIQNYAEFMQSSNFAC